MKAMKLERIPEVRVDMLIRRPAADVFEAFANPDVTTKFWFTKSSGRLEKGARIRWAWEMYGVSDELLVTELVPGERIRVEFSDGTAAEWTFAPREGGHTYVTIVNTGFAGNGDEIVAQALDAMGGYTMVLCGAKAYLEHGIALNLVADRAPDAHTAG